MSLRVENIKAGYGERSVIEGISFGVESGQIMGLFGHNGAGGQIAWADPVSGVSFVYLTNGFDRDPVRQGRRGVALSSLAGDLI